MTFSFLLVGGLLVWMFWRKYYSAEPEITIKKRRRQANSNAPKKEQPFNKSESNCFMQQTKIFKTYDVSMLKDSPLEQELKLYPYPIVAYYVGTLENKTEYAIMIGTSDEWVNVIAYNRAKEPVYNDHGFSLIRKNWSYGSKVFGAPQIREVIKNNLPEIKEIMATQESVRQEKALLKKASQSLDE